MEWSIELLCTRALTTLAVEYFALMFESGYRLMQVSLLEVIQDVHIQPEEQPVVRKANL